MKRVLVGLVVAVTALGALGLYGFFALKDLRNEMEGLRDEVVALEEANARQVEDNAVAQALILRELETAQDNLTDDLDTFRRDVQSMRSEIGDRPLNRGTRSLWELVDELYDTIPGLVATPSPGLEQGICILPDDATLVQDIRSYVREELDREASDEEIAELLVEYQAIMDDECASEAATACVSVGGFYYAHTGGCELG